MYYLYRHIRLDKNVPFYIGIGTVRKTPKTLKSKYDRAYNKHIKGRNEVWHRIVNITPYEVEIIFETDNKKFIKEKEKEFINLYGIINDGGTLCNMTYGGDGMYGYKIKETTRIKLKNKKKGHLNPNYGKPLSVEHRLRIKLSNKGRKISKESIENVRNNCWANKKILCVTTGELFISAAAAARRLFPEVKNKTARTNIARATNQNIPYKNIIFKWFV